MIDSDNSALQKAAKMRKRLKANDDAMYHRSKDNDDDDVVVESFDGKNPGYFHAAEESVPATSVQYLCKSVGT